jgi:hypothetical protein
MQLANCFELSGLAASSRMYVVRASGALCFHQCQVVRAIFIIPPPMKLFVQWCLLFCRPCDQVLSSTLSYNLHQPFPAVVRAIDVNARDAHGGTFLAWDRENLASSTLREREMINDLTTIALTGIEFSSFCLLMEVYVFLYRS